MTAQPMLANITVAVSQMLVSYVPPFLSFGVNMFRALAVILIMIEGYKWYFKGPDAYRLSHTVFIIALAHAATYFYVQAIPGIGVSVSHIIPDQAHFWLARLDTSAVDSANNHISEMWKRFETPSLTAIFENLLYWLGTMVIIGAKVVSIAVISYGLIASAICTIVGPLFLVFGMLDATRWLMWGWIKAAMTYAYVPVIAVLWLMAGETFLFAVLSTLPATIPASQYLTYFIQVGSVLGVLCFGLLAVPSLTSTLFSGHAHHASPLSVLSFMRR